METNRQKKIGGVIQKDLVDILQGEIRKNNISNLIISVSKVINCYDRFVGCNRAFKYFSARKSSRNFSSNQVECRFN